ncbi:MAG TPA: hypothetical protein VEQ10_08895 [Vicinamibacteria bacterium]|nr:hypothetical protein [Vicinamibacteria bacterium]
MNSLDVKITVFRQVLAAARTSDVPFALGGGLAISFYAGLWRPSKDLDLYILRADKEPARSGLTPTAWSTGVGPIMRMISLPQGSVTSSVGMVPMRWRRTSSTSDGVPPALVWNTNANTNREAASAKAAVSSVCDCRSSQPVSCACVGLPIGAL